MNYCFFKGKLPQEPKIFTTQKGTKLAKFSITQYEDFNGNKRFTYPNFTAFGEVAEKVENYTHKGTTVAVECRYTESDYTNKDGDTVKDKSFIVNSIKVLMQAEDTYAAQQQKQQYQAQQTQYQAPVQQQFDAYTGEAPEITITGDDLPF